jgi:hypothetical protein
MSTLLLRRILEADDEETIKDILGADYHEPPDQPEHGEVVRHDRWANVKIGAWDFCISYLTPVAFYEPGAGITITEKRWSHATLKHVMKWADDIGFGDFNHYAELEAHAKIMPQEELIALFKQKAGRVDWTRRQSRGLAAVPYRRIAMGLKGGREDRVEIEPLPRA